VKEVNVRHTGLLDDVHRCADVLQFFIGFLFYDVLVFSFFYLFVYLHQNKKERRSKGKKNVTLKL
jgi:hypothetical protein